VKNIFCRYISFSCLTYYPHLHKTFLLVVENVVFSDLLVIIFATDSLESDYQETFLRVKAASAWGWQPHHLHVPNFMEIWEPKSPERSGPHRACYGTLFTDILIGLHFMRSNRQVTKAWVCGLSLVETADSNAAGVMDVSCECCVLSDRGLYCRLITRPEESCREACGCVWSCSLNNEDYHAH
jgi:hypothetical protein